ncbi:MAG: methylmalonyl-CoA epimerase, partial [Odoribacter sp.]|nr:methylmalonyl-CoA epimerase [Odoribacter sp.]
MTPTHIEHIGIAVQSLDEAIPFYEKVLGLKCYAIEEVADQKVKTAFFKVGQTKIELLESTDPEGPIGKFVEKTGGGMHHLAFAVEDVGQALKDAEEAGCQLIDKEPRQGAEGLKIGFLHPKSTFRVLTELCG